MRKAYQVEQVPTGISKKSGQQKRQGSVPQRTADEAKRSNPKQTNELESEVVIHVARARSGKG